MAWPPVLRGPLAFGPISISALFYRGVLSCISAERHVDCPSSGDRSFRFAAAPAFKWIQRVRRGRRLDGYGVSFPDMFRRAATYVDKILKGAGPSDLPIEQPTKFETIVNLKTAKAIGFDVPTALLLRADEVIE